MPAGTDLLVVAGATARFVEPELAGLRQVPRSRRPDARAARPGARSGGGLHRNRPRELARRVRRPGRRRHRRRPGRDGAVLPAPRRSSAGAAGAHPIVRSLEQAKVGGDRRAGALGRRRPGARGHRGAGRCSRRPPKAGAKPISPICARSRKDAKDLTGPVPLAVAVGAPANEAPARSSRRRSWGRRRRRSRRAGAGSRPGGWSWSATPTSRPTACSSLSGNPTLARQRLQLAARPPEAARHRSEEARAGADDAHAGSALGDHLAGARGAAGAGDRRRRRGLLPAPEVGRCDPRRSSILAVVVGALLALIYFAEDKVASTDERAAAAKQLVAAEADEIVALAIEWQGQPGALRARRALVSEERASRTAPERDAASRPRSRRPWRIVEPFAKRADDAAVARLLASLDRARGRARPRRRAARRCRPRAAARVVTWKTANVRGAARDRRHRAGDARRRRRGERPACAGGDLRRSRRRPRPAGRRVARAGRSIAATARAHRAGDDLQRRRAATIVLARSGETLLLESPVADRRRTRPRRSPARRSRRPAHGDLPRPAARARRRSSALAAPVGVLEVDDRRRARTAAHRGRRRDGRRASASGAPAARSSRAPRPSPPSSRGRRASGAAATGRASRTGASRRRASRRPPAPSSWCGTTVNGSGTARRFRSPWRAIFSPR